MLRKTLLFFSLFCIVKLNAQDILVMSTGKEIRVKVTEINEKSVYYKEYEHLNGPTYNAALNEVFVIIYKNGVREFFSTNENTSGEKNKNVNVISAPLAILQDNNFEARLVSTQNIPDKKNKLIKVKAEIDIYLKSSLFDHLTLTVEQDKTVRLDYTNINWKYYSNSSASFWPKIHSGFLFERHESSSGKGYGWALPSGFFNTDMQYCSIAFLSQKGFQKEQKLIGGIKDAVKIDLKNCSTMENKLLSVALAWLEVNFIK